ncbi:E3 ubiquitin-protein ligase RNF146 [Striga asiatica]|uniref:E3 ubiquitin-protein ligase RNF146 n=1 Tax=Striga asiatica TaxID=4170 RepID=A0A5A7P731_STRAF|nr:E3 ubiquitin-protein ligase RNF146 [Striga asiatica]
MPHQPHKNLFTLPNFHPAPTKCCRPPRVKSRKVCQRVSDLRRVPPPRPLPDAAASAQSAFGFLQRRGDVLRGDDFVDGLLPPSPSVPASAAEVVKHPSVTTNVKRWVSDFRLMANRVNFALT